MSCRLNDSKRNMAIEDKSERENMYAKAPMQEVVHLLMQREIIYILTS